MLLGAIRRHVDVLFALGLLRRHCMPFFHHLGEEEDALMWIGGLWVNIHVHTHHEIEESSPRERGRLPMSWIIRLDMRPMDVLAALVFV